MVCHPHRPGGFGPVHHPGDLAIGPGLPVGNIPQRLPYRNLKLRAMRRQRNGKGVSSTVEILLQLRGGPAGQRRLPFRIVVLYSLLPEKYPAEPLPVIQQAQGTNGLVPIQNRVHSGLSSKYFCSIRLSTCVENSIAEL